jgi:hypothetical protein
MIDEVAREIAVRRYGLADCLHVPIAAVDEAAISTYGRGWGVTLHGTPGQMAENHRRGAFIQYADLTELMLMLDMKLGGGVMAAVNEGQRLVRPRSV